jgi:N utilization substance protein B
VIDNIILKMALAEFFHFPSIPTKVTINEYIELAKNYSTPQSKKFINGVLDAIQKDLKKEGVLLKN